MSSNMSIHKSVFFKLIKSCAIISNTSSKWYTTQYIIILANDKIGIRVRVMGYSHKNKEYFIRTLTLL